VGGFQTASIKAPAGRVTSVDAELFAIGLAIAKATTGCPNIVVIYCFPAAKRAVDMAIHSGQGHSITISRLIRSHFETHPEGSLHFWDCPSNARWFIHAEVHNEVTRTHCPVQEQMQTLYDALSQENSKKCLEEWITDFSRGNTRG